MKTNGVSSDRLKIQKIDGSALYDALELSFNSADKCSILKLNNVDILASINNKAVSNDVYTNDDIDLTFSSLIGSAPAILNTSVELATDLGNDSKYATTIHNHINNKADKLDTYMKSEINVALGILQAGIDNRVWVNAVDINDTVNLK